MSGSDHDRAGSQGMRPWEAWRAVRKGGVVIGLCLFAVGVLTMAAASRVTGAAVTVCGVGVLFVIWARLFWAVVGERVVMWERLVAAVVPFDRTWIPRLPPKVVRYEKGLIVLVSPPPAVERGILTQALGRVAAAYGLQVLGSEILLPHGFVRRSVGREVLRIELGR